MSKLVETMHNEAWVRTCQECGHRQLDKEPSEGMSDAYRNRKCKRCKSESLDYGSTNYSDDSYADN